MDVRDNMKTSISSSAENLAYKERMPNLPYMFADSDVTFYWRDLGKKGNLLTVSYDNQYLHSFTYYSSRIGSNKGDYVVPNQFSHNLSLSYSLQKGGITYHWNAVTSQTRNCMIILVFRRQVGLFMASCVFVSAIKKELVTVFIRTCLPSACFVY